MKQKEDWKTCAHLTSEGNCAQEEWEWGWNYHCNHDASKLYHEKPTQK